jgi:hypothetical protein
MASRDYRQLGNTDLYQCEKCGDRVWAREQHDQSHAATLLHTVSDYVAKEIARHMSDY